MRTRNKPQRDSEVSLCPERLEDDQNQNSLSNDAPEKMPAKEELGPTFLLMAGFAGAGKTTLATMLNKKFLQNNEIGWKVLNKDDLKRNRLAGGEEVERAGWNAFEDLFALITREVIVKGKSVIIDTSNEKPFIYENIVKVLEQMERDCTPACLKVILCVANKETRTKRLLERGSVFAPYVDELPTILDDSELSERFHHLLLNDAQLLERCQHLLDNSKEQEHFRYLVGKEAFIVNTNLPLEVYVDDIWNEIKAFLR